ncbi:MAG: DUF3592 domain-containing protein [Clostridia bacterium]|nr:DUF3592 domain-containing protein [Clostridia bacterium]
MELFNKIRKYSNVRFWFGFAAASIFIVVFSIVAIAAPKGEVELTTGTISDIIEEYDAINNATDYHVIITYSAAGKKYENAEYGSYSYGMKIGDTVEVEYSVEDPTIINAPGSEYIPFVTLIVGAAALIFSIISAKKAIKRSSEDYNEYDRVDLTKIDPAVADEIRSSTEPKNNYFFHFTGKMNQSYALEDENHRMIYEAKLRQFTLIKDSTYEFINHITGASEEMKIGHTVSQSISNGNFGFKVPISSAFKVNGVSNWDYLAEKGFGFQFSMNGIKPCFNVKRYGVDVAYIETTGADVFGEKETKNPLYKLPVNGFFRVECRDSDLDGVFMTCFSIARAVFYEND